MDGWMEHQLGPPLSLADGALNFSLGEYVLVRIPGRIQVNGQVDDEVTAGTALPLTSNGTSTQHFAFIRQVTIHTPGSYLLEVYPVLFFTSSAGHSELDDATRATLLPLPPLSLHHPTPEAFGPPLDLGTWSTSRDSWLSIVPRRFSMPTSRPFKRMNPPLVMPFSVLNRIELYRETLRSGDRGGQATSGATLVTSPPTIIGDGEGDKAAGAGLEQFSFEAAHDDILVLEGVDEDAEGADATMRDELIMLAHGDPMWTEELRKYLQKEEEERKRMQEERAARLALWRDGVDVQPT
ncbi:hypothetical protein D9615_009488 [Tricholomella constricta]|uniref:Uncharacterized protein n=1 Tax=Tricholomella constricta TaxID=117010 RepID=A0A8H5GYM3_9AGAR|nr:hypothetical protein D9615_009488 [Tricholomella constricta]